MLSLREKKKKCYFVKKTYFIVDSLYSVRKRFRFNVVSFLRNKFHLCVLVRKIEVGLFLEKKWSQNEQLLIIKQKIYQYNVQ